VERALPGLLAVVLAGCCSAGGKPNRASAVATPSPTAPAGAPDAVSIHLVAFDPARLEVAAGTTVTWTQTDEGSIHTVTSGTVETDATGATTADADARFDSGQLTHGERFSFTFSEPGTYPYFCVIHQATMRGEVSVR
jgi:plastocyanin